MDNIRYGNKKASDEDVIRAAKTVCAHDFIVQMEDGYNTQVNERGSRLSVGQRQLISFARALLADPAILILDEATSSIDTETEIVLQEGLSHLLEDVPRLLLHIVCRQLKMRTALCMLQMVRFWKVVLMKNCFRCTVNIMNCLCRSIRHNKSKKQSQRSMSLS